MAEAENDKIPKCCLISTSRCPRDASEPIVGWRLSAGLDWYPFSQQLQLCIERSCFRQLQVGWQELRGKLCHFKQRLIYKPVSDCSRQTLDLSQKPVNAWHLVWLLLPLSVSPRRFYWERKNQVSQSRRGRLPTHFTFVSCRHRARGLEKQHFLTTLKKLFLRLIQRDKSDSLLKDSDLQNIHTNYYIYSTLGKVSSEYKERPSHLHFDKDIASETHEFRHIAAFLSLHTVFLRSWFPAAPRHPLNDLLSPRLPTMKERNAREGR